MIALFKYSFATRGCAATIAGGLNEVQGVFLEDEVDCLCRQEGTFVCTTGSRF